MMTDMSLHAVQHIRRLPELVQAPQYPADSPLCPDSPQRFEVNKLLLVCLFTGVPAGHRCDQIQTPETTHSMAQRVLRFESGSGA